MAGSVPKLPIAAAAIAGTAICVVAGLITAASSATVDIPLEVTGRVLMVALPIGVGLYAWSRPASARFGRNLTLIGFGAGVATLAASDDRVLYSVGRTAAWILEAGFFYLVLSFPSGRLPERIDRVLASAAALIVFVLYLPSALLVDEFPVPAPFSSCTADCPTNALQLVGAEPSVMDSVVRPLRETLSVLLLAVVAVRLAQRMRTSGHLARRMLEPVLVVALARMVVFAAGFVLRAVVPDSTAVVVAVWLIAMGVPAMALAFLFGVLEWRLSVGTALERLGRHRVSGSDPEELRAALADAFEDPALEILYWLPNGHGRWVDAEGHLVEPPSPASGRRLTEVTGGGGRVAALVHDEALAAEPALLESAANYALVALENQRLAAKTAALLREVQQSRARIAASADEERRRIERDLHDGAQQRLVALRLRLQLAAELLAKDHDRGTAMVEQLGLDAEAALEEVRSLARGVFPSVLEDRGLAEALQSAGLRSPLPVVVVAQRGRRYAHTVESAAYFCCLEAMQNAAKHATGASRLTITLAERNGDLTLEVADDGPGFDPQSARRGAGLRNMRDRVQAAGGDIVLESAAGQGTRVRAKIPLPHDASDGEPLPASDP